MSTDAIHTVALMAAILRASEEPGARTPNPRADAEEAVNLYRAVEVAITAADAGRAKTMDIKWYK